MDPGEDAGTEGRLEREPEEGNLEYKLRLASSSEERLQRLATQMRYRLEEGGGEAFYELGVSDDGDPVGLPDGELARSLEVLGRVAELAGARIMVVREGRGRRGRVVEVLVRRVVDSPPVQVSVALLGNVDAGKSTLKGVLVTGRLDDGDGLAMSLVAKYPHELTFRRSSSVTHHVLGFDDSGRSVNDLLGTYDESRVYLSSSKVVTLVDLAGHERYLKTTLRGVLGSGPDYAAMVVGANAGPVGSFREHLGISVAMGIPIFVVVTKVDMVDREVTLRTLREVGRILKLPGVNKIPFLIRSRSDAALAARNMPHGRAAPIFLVSNVTGRGLDLLKAFLNSLPPRIDWAARRGLPLLCYVDEKFDVTGVGLVVAGLVEQGRAARGGSALLGPLDDGSYREVRIRSIHVNRIPVDSAEAGQIAAFALSGIPYDSVRRGMVLVDPSSGPRAVREFEAEVRILHHPTTIRPGYEPVIQLKTIRQTARLVRTGRPYLRSGDVDRVVFRFLMRPEHVRVGDVFFFREGRTRGMGRVTSVTPVGPPGGG